MENQIIKSDGHDYSVKYKQSQIEFDEYEALKKRVDQIRDEYMKWEVTPDLIQESKNARALLHKKRKETNDLKNKIVKMVDEELAKGADPFKLVRERLIPAIQEVGALYEKKEYFLPQLLRSASAMQDAFSHIKPLLEEKGQSTDKQKIILATVQGDIHDIGKNIVGLLLSNHGYEIIDLGKDVPAETIVAKAIEENVQLIGLSALMTTTMPRMEETIKLLQKKNCSCKVMIGGAVVTGEYAKSIHAHGYALDAVEAVRVAKELLDS